MALLLDNYPMLLTFIHANIIVCTPLPTHPPPAGPTCIVGQSSVVRVKREPPLLPGLHPPPPLGQEAGAAARRQPQVRAAGHPVTQGLHVGPEVEVGGEEEGQAARLQRQTEFICESEET